MWIKKFLVPIQILLWSSKVGANIIRLAHKRSARFELRQTDRVHAYGFTAQIEVRNVQECLDKCTSTDHCKSINYQYHVEELPNEEQPEFHKCQLVNYDSNLDPVYNFSIGWHHYDTGIQRFSRLTHTTQALKVCARPAQNTAGYKYGCSITTSSYYVKTHDITDCDNIDAWYEFDLLVGTLRSLCTGKFIQPTTFANGYYIYHYATPSSFTGKNRFRRNFRK